MPPFDRIPFILNQIPDQQTQMQALHDAMTEAAADAARALADSIASNANLFVHWQDSGRSDAYIAIPADRFETITGHSRGEIMERLRRQPEPPG